MVIFHNKVGIMTNREKKAKAAAIAVSCYFQLENECENDSKCHGWRRMNKLLVMQRRGLLQLKGRSPGNFRLRM